MRLCVYLVRNECKELNISGKILDIFITFNFLGVVSGFYLVQYLIASIFYELNKFLKFSIIILYFSYSTNFISSIYIGSLHYIRSLTVEVEARSSKIMCIESL